MNFSSEKQVTRGWTSWKHPKAKSKFRWDPEVGHAARGALLIDMSADESGSLSPGAAWYFLQNHKPGTRLRLTVWGMCDTTNPNARLYLNVRWRNKQSLWYKSGELHGTRKISATPGKWHPLSLDIVVPDDPNIKYMSLGLGSENAYPGRVWFDDVSIAIVK